MGWDAVLHARLPSIPMTRVKDLNLLEQATYDIINGPLRVVMVTEPCASSFQMEACLTLKVSTRSHMFLRICLMNTVTSCVVLRCHRISESWTMNWMVSQGSEMPPCGP